MRNLSNAPKLQSKADYALTALIIRLANLSKIRYTYILIKIRKPYSDKIDANLMKIAVVIPAVLNVLMSLRNER